MPNIADKKPQPVAKLATPFSPKKKVRGSSAVAHREYCREVLERSLKLGLGQDFDKHISANDIRIFLNNGLWEMQIFQSEYEQNKLEGLSISGSCRSYLQKHFGGTMDVWVRFNAEPAVRVYCTAGEIDAAAMAHRLGLRHGSVLIDNQPITAVNFVDIVTTLRKKQPELGTNELNPIPVSGMNIRIQKLFVCNWLRQQVTCLTAPYRTTTATDTEIVSDPCVTMELEEFKTWTDYKPRVEDMMKNDLQQEKYLRNGELYLPPLWQYDEASCPFSADSMADLRTMLSCGLSGHLNHIMRVLELGVEYGLGGSCKSASSADIIMRKATKIKCKAVNKDILALIQTWPVSKTDTLEGRALWDLYNDPEIGPHLRPALDQLIGDAELDEAPLGVLASNRVVFFIRFPQDGQNKTLEASPPFLWNGPEEDATALAGFLYLAQLASALYPKASSCPLTTTLCSRSTANKMLAQDCDAMEVDATCNTAVTCLQQQRAHATGLHDSASSNICLASSSDDGRSAHSSSDGSASVLRRLPYKSLQDLGFSGRCLGGGSHTKVLEGFFQNTRVAIKLYKMTHPPTRESFHKEVSMYTKFLELQGIAMPNVKLACYIGKTGYAALVLTLGEKLATTDLKSTTRGAAKASLQRLHDKGYAHGDIRREHLVKYGEKVWLISLRQCEAGVSKSKQKFELQKLKECF